MLHCLAGGPDRNLTGSKRPEETAGKNVFSRDGKLIAYFWFRPAGSEVRIVEVDGKAAPRVLHTNPEVESIGGSIPNRLPGRVFALEDYLPTLAARN